MACAVVTAASLAGTARGQQNCDGGLDTGLTDLQWNADPRVWNDIGTICSRVCSSDGYFKGVACFKWGSAFQCVSSTISKGQSMSLSAGFSGGGFSVTAGVTFTASQSFSCDASDNKKCQFFVCHDSVTIQPWDCETFYPWGTYDSDVDVFGTFAGTTVVCCCEAANCLGPHIAGDGGDGVASGPGNTVGSVLIDLSEFFTITGGLPPPGHPILGPHEFFDDLTEWHLCEIQQTAQQSEAMEGFPINEIVIMDIDGTTHHFNLDVDPFPFWDDELTQSASLDVVPGTGDACIDGRTGLSLESAFARSYDLSAIPETAGSDFLVNCVVFGIESNTGTDLGGMIRLYEDTDGGAPSAPGADLVLLGEVNTLIPSSPGPNVLSATMDQPILVPADSVLVVELSYPAHTSGVVLPGANSLGQTGPTFFRADDCGFPTYVDVASIGLPDEHWVQVVVGETVGPCPWDCEPLPDGTVGITDFLSLLAQWGQVGTSCDFGGGGVGITDFLKLLANWGACP